MIYVVCYDITDDSRRQKVCELLKGYGTHVQYSVFECDLEEKELLRKMIKDILAEINESEDFVRIYPLCGWCTKSVLIYGQGKLEYDNDFYII